MCPLLYEWGHGSESQSAGWEELERNLGLVWEKLAVSMLVSQTPVTDSKLKWTFYLQQEARVAASQAEQTQLLAKPAQPYLWLLHGHTANLWELEFFNSVTSKSVWIFKVKCFFFTPLKWNYHKIWIIFFILQDKKKPESNDYFHLSCRWLVNGTAVPLNLDRYSLVAGTLVISSPDPIRDTGSYQCLAINRCGTIISRAANLKFGCK